jgi:hypothetical protein
MHVVGARLGDDVHRRAGGPAELRRERVGQHGEFLDRAERHRCEHRLAAPAFVVAGPIEHNGRGAAAARRR